MVVAAGVVGGGQGAAGSPCPCVDPGLCAPISTPPPAREVFTYHLTPTGSATWAHYDWSIITSISLFGEGLDNNLTCFAHSQNVRVSFSTYLDNAQVGNRTYEDGWINSTIETVVTNWLDGVNLDIEGYTGNSTNLVSLVARLTAALRKVQPGAQVTFDTTIAADWGNSSYDFPALAQVVDFLLPMGYDMCWGDSTGTPNSPLSGLQQELMTYMTQLGIPANKLALGVPWYGYAFPCNSTPTGVGTCNSSAPFSPTWLTPFGTITDALLPIASPVQYTTDGTMSAFVNYRMTAAQMDEVHRASRARFPHRPRRHGHAVSADGQAHPPQPINNSSAGWYQLWFDDEHTLAYKYELAARLGLRGIAMWNAAYVNYTDNIRGATMWHTLATNFTAALP